MNSNNYGFSRRVLFVSASRKGLFGFVLICSLVTLPLVHAQSTSAYDNASCGASFINSCPGQDTLVATDSGTAAAPLPIVGATIWEIIVALTGLSVVLRARHHKSKRAGSEDDL